MQVSVQKLSSVLLEFDVVIEADQVRSELDKAYARLAKSVRVPGFRPGKAPRSVLTHMFGPRVAADVAQRLVDDTYPKAAGEQKIQAVNQPSIEPQKLVENLPFSYKARVEIIPDIENVVFEGFEISRPKVEVSEALLDAELLRIRRQNASLEPLKAERPAESGDVVTVDFDVEADEKIVAEAGAKDFEVELGSDALIPEIGSALTGKKPGDSAEALIDVPGNHPNKALRGKKVTFKLTLKDIKTRVLPELDDEFAKDLGEYETLADLKQKLTQELERQQKEQSDMRVAEQLVEHLVRSNQIEVPPSLVQRQAQMTEQELVSQARRAGQQGSLTSEMRNTILRDSEGKVRAGLLMAAIAKKQEIKIGDTEIEEGLKELAEQSGKNIAKVRAEYRDPKKREMLVGMILENKVLDLIEAKAKVQEG
jgi:trigger factor